LIPPIPRVAVGIAVHRFTDKTLLKGVATKTKEAGKPRTNIHKSKNPKIQKP
jgi:hypothetical protein